MKATIEEVLEANKDKMDVLLLLAIQNLSQLTKILIDQSKRIEDRLLREEKTKAEVTKKRVIPRRIIPMTVDAPTGIPVKRHQSQGQGSASNRNRS